MRILRRSQIVLGAALLLGVPAALDAAATLPDWAIVGDYDVAIPVGYGSVASRYAFDLGDFNANVTLRYEKKGKLSGGGTAGEFGTHIYGVSGSWDTDPATGRARVRFSTDKRAPEFTFEGVMTEDRRGIEGTYTRGPGFGDSQVTASGPLTIIRVPPSPAENTFRLRFAARQNIKGKVSTAFVDVVGAKLPQVEATLTLFGGEVLGGGKVSGKVKTSKDGTSSAKLQVKGKGWRVKMKGPVDEAGFHAVADVKTKSVRLRALELTLPVEDGPDAPPPPPPPAPKNLLDGALARVQGSMLTITRERASKRFFKKKADLTIQMPIDVGTGITHATPATSGGQAPVRFFFEQKRGKTYGTATVPADVALDVQRLSLTPGGTIQIHATGETYAPTGKRIVVDVIILATVVQ